MKIYLTHEGKEQGINQIVENQLYKISEEKLKLYMEIQPSRFRKKLGEQFEAIKSVTKKIHIPDAPMGYPKASSLAIATIAIDYGLEPTIHLRTTDYSLVGFVNQIYGAFLLGINRILLLRGDPPFSGSIIRDISPEDGIRMIRKDERLSDLKIGLTISLRYPDEKILERLKVQPDFVLITHKTEEKLLKLNEIYHGEKIGYLIIRTPSNQEYIDPLPQKEDICMIYDVWSCIEKHKNYLDSILISCPGDVIDCVNVLRTLK